MRDANRFDALAVSSSVSSIGWRGRAVLSPHLPWQVICIVLVALCVPWHRARPSPGRMRQRRARGATAVSFCSALDDASPSVADLSGWLPKPAGKSGQVHAEGDGHLYAGADRIRFFGVDLAFSGNIPTHGDAEKIAARMAKFASTSSVFISWT